MEHGLYYPEEVTAMEEHGCGGILHPVQLLVEQRDGRFLFAFPVPGLRCDRCGEEVMPRDIAFALEGRLACAHEMAMWDPPTATYRILTWASPSIAIGGVDMPVLPLGDERSQATEDADDTRRTSPSTLGAVA